MDISIVIPVYDEEGNVEELYRRIKKAMEHIKREYEIIFVDDGSKDSTFKILERLHEHDRKLKVVKFRRNFGQTAAMSAGFSFAGGDIIITLDGDLQNDPADIPLLLKKMEEGYDVVSGWRSKRKDPLSKVILSRIAYVLRQIVMRDKIHDAGCSLKAYKKECFDDLDLYGEMHRFIPALLIWRGFKVGEVKVQHHPRTHGKTKYNLKRVVKASLDALIVRFWARYSVRPIHFFGMVGAALSFFGVIIGAYLSALKIFYGESIGNRPLLLLSILLVLLGIQVLLFGFLADIMIKIYYKDRTPHNIEKILK